MIHEDRRRARSFGEVALQYDRVRPTYPDALVDHLMADGPGHVLDVGCGTGKAARLFVARGCDVLGVEPDARMAEVARTHGLAVEVATFEDWEPAGRTFDLVISAQAWHWVNPEVSAAKAADVLRPQGRLGVFWNYIRLRDDTRTALERVYLALAPDMTDNYMLGALAKDAPTFRSAIEATARFDGSEVLAYEWERRLSRDEWVDLLPTQSDHRVLPPGQRDALLAAVAGAIDDLGGSVFITFETELITARRLAS